MVWPLFNFYQGENYTLKNLFILRFFLRQQPATLPTDPSAAAGASLALSPHRKNEGIISQRAVFRGFLPIVCFLHDAFGACFHEKTPGNDRAEEILVSWGLRRER